MGSGWIRLRGAWSSSGKKRLVRRESPPRTSWGGADCRRGIFDKTSLSCRTDCQSAFFSSRFSVDPRNHADRKDLEKSDQAFFNQNGFITDSIPEVDASRELLRAQNEAKARNREDRIKNGSLD